MGDILSNENEPLARRMRLLWRIRMWEDQQEAVKALEKGFISNSALLKHELAYVMGQIGNPCAIPKLEQVLSNQDENSMVRHECAEALGAIGDKSVIPILEKYLNDPVREVRETCYLALKAIEVKDVESCKSDSFECIDPAPPMRDKTTKELREILLNPKEDLFKRYKAMFGLRNKAKDGDEEAVKALCDSFTEEEGALFKHEIAFVLGQLQLKSTAPTLKKVLENKNEHEMVRHEAAEALGSISDPDSLEILKKYRNDENQPVRDSCIVAIDMHEYWSRFN